MLRRAVLAVGRALGWALVGMLLVGVVLYIRVLRSGPELDSTLDSVRDRFGAQSVTRATQLGRSPGLIVPQLPD